MNKSPLGGGPLTGKSIRERLRAMEETRDERCFRNYEKYLKKWSNYEEMVEEHFRNKDVLKYGSERQAQIVKAKKTS